MFNEIGKNFCVCLACKFYTPALKVLLNTGIIFNYSVMNNDEVAFIGNLRMGIQFIRFTMRGPPCMSHSHCPVKAGFVNQLLKIFNSAYTFKDPGLSVYNSNTRRIISAIL